ncbi:DNA recombination protein RmuC [Paraferrimonas sp. SM1919]|uniref:DNA recombination protein RmuC n=1 Tax=Paraferrimonas sp. SM1919 TaxID=2662263 RepID=UPI0013D4BB8A|nr:DNA recombination protein RmuC [Paraferrimonas sp. SM1919]
MDTNLIITAAISSMIWLILLMIYWRVQSSKHTKLVLAHTELRTRLVYTEQSNLELKQQHQQLSAELQQAQAQQQQLQQQYVQLQTSQHEKQQHHQQQLQLLQDSKKQLKQEFENLANEILEKKSKTFTELNSQSVSSILNPIHNELKGFKQKVEDIHNKETAQRSALKNELENLQKLNQNITQEAQRLTSALQGEKKTQGNWGELMLENILDKSGLRLGEDYQREVALRSEDGLTRADMRPDVVVNLPQDKHMVIDAKTSLNAYTRFVNSEHETERNLALADHISAIKNHINTLADKNYGKLIGINAPEVVVMFVPIESAYVEAIKHDEGIFQAALEKNILVATPTTLLTSLNIIRQLWRFEQQSKHSAELANRAEKFYNKLNTFLSSMKTVGDQLDKAKDNYELAMGQLINGRGNLIKQASEFKQLGVSVNKELPKEIVAKAQLELDQ